MDEPSLVSLPTTKWRVKLYKLINSQWTDTGTGTCWGELVENAPQLVVEDEDDPTRELLRSAVGTQQTTYQKQDTLIIWTEAVDGAASELALSFQEVTGSIIVCEFLVYARTVLGAEIDVVTQQNNETEALVENAVLPPLPLASNLALVLQRLGEGCKSGYGRDSISVWFLQSEYLAAMAALFGELEGGGGAQSSAANSAFNGAANGSATAANDHPTKIGSPDTLDDTQTSNGDLTAPSSSPAKLSSAERLEALHDLCEIAKALFNMGENLFIDMLLEDALFSSFLGMLEYDREFGKRKANYRRYFAEGFTYKEILPIEDPVIVEKIRKTFRLQLLKDVVLARLLDDTLFGVLTSLILVSYMEIITWLQNNADFMTKIFALYDPPGPPSDVKDDGVVFLTHILSQSKVFAQQRGPLYASLIDHGLLKALAYGLMRPNRELKSASLECIRLLLDSDINVIESSKPVMCALLDLCKHSDPGFRGLQLQACETLKGMLEPPTNPNFEKTFYESCADEVFAELASPTMRLDYDPDVLVDFLGYCLRHHRASSDRLLSGLGLWNVIANLLASSLSRSALLSCVRCLKYMVVGCSDADVCKLLESGALANALALLEKIGNVNTLLHSALLDLLVACGEPSKAAPVREWILANKPHLRASAYPPLVALLRNTKRPSETGDLRESHVAQRFKPDDAGPGPGTPRPKKPLKRGFQAAGQSDAPRDALVSFKE